MSTRRSSVGVGVVKGLLYAVRILLDYLSLLKKFLSIYKIVPFRSAATTEPLGSVSPASNATTLKPTSGNPYRKCQLAEAAPV